MPGVWRFRYNSGRFTYGLATYPICCRRRLFTQKREAVFALMRDERLENMAWRLRVSLLWLVLLGIVGIAVLLAYERHWESYLQWIPWACLGLIFVSLVLVVLIPGVGTRRLAQVVTLVTVIVSIVGMWQHFDANYDSASENPAYAARWEEMSIIEKVWEVAGGTVGQVPVYAAAALVPVALALLMATAGLGEQERQMEYVDPRQRR